MRIRGVRVIPLMAVVLTLASCPMDDRPGSNGGGTEARFTAGGAGYGRTVIDGNGELLWVNDDRIGIYMADHGGPLPSSGPGNVQYKVTAGGGSAAAVLGAVSPDETIYYPAGGGAVDFTAYYPYSSGAVTAGHTVPVDVGGQGNPAAIDVQWVKTDNNGNGYTASSGTVSLGFNHVLSKLLIEVRGDGAGVTDLTGMTVTFSMDAAGVLNLAEGTVTPSGSPSTVSPRCTQEPATGVNGKYEAILLPGDFPAAAFTLDGVTYTWDLDSTFPGGFEGGKKYGAVVTVNSKTLTVTAVGSGMAWSGDGQGANGLPRFTVTFNGNSSNGGTVPGAILQTGPGATVAIPGNTGNLVKTDCEFVGWNTRADGLGTDYPAGSPSMTPVGNTTLYAQWEGWNVTTVAGDGTADFADGKGTAAQFSGPHGITIDGVGNLYVAESGGNRIRKIDPSGNVTTIAGDGTANWLDGLGTAAWFKNPDGITVDNDGNLYVADTFNHRIRKIATSGNVTTIAGSGTQGNADAPTGPGIAAEFSHPTGITIDSAGNLYVTDNTGRRIRKIDPSFNVTTIAGSGASGNVDGSGIAAQFTDLAGITIDSAGNLYLSQNGANNRCIRTIDTSFNVTTIAGSTIGNVDGTGTAAKFGAPQGITIDSAGNLFVTDTINHHIRKINPSGVVTTIAGSGASGYADGNGTTTQFSSPYGITIDAAGNLFVADSSNNRIRKIAWQRIY